MFFLYFRVLNLASDYLDHQIRLSLKQFSNSLANWAKMLVDEVLHVVCGSGKRLVNFGVLKHLVNHQKSSCDPPIEICCFQKPSDQRSLNKEYIFLDAKMVFNFTIFTLSLFFLVLIPLVNLTNIDSLILPIIL
jgi:hypothetical protein